MSYEIAIMNPRRRRNKKGRFVKSSKRRHNPRKKVSRRKKRASGYTIGSAPVRRRKLNPRRRKKSRRRYNPRVIHRIRRRRRNPRLLSGLSVKGVVNQMIPAAVGAAGAVGLDVILGYVNPKLPSALQTGIAQGAVRIAAAIGLGMVASKIGPLKKYAASITNGGLTVAFYNIAKAQLKSVAPALPGLGDYEEITVGYMDPASTIDGMGAYLTNGSAQDVGAYMDGVGAYMQDGINI